MHRGGDIPFGAFPNSRSFLYIIFTAVFTWSLRRMIKVSERGARDWQPAIPPQVEQVRCFCCGTFSEAQNEHLAIEVCEVAVHTSRFDCYLQWFGTCHFENEQTAAEGRRVTVSIGSVPVYLRCFRTFQSTVFLR